VEKKKMLMREGKKANEGGGINPVLGHKNPTKPLEKFPPKPLFNLLVKL